MSEVEPSSELTQAARGLAHGLFGLPRQVWLLGLASLLTDTASEAIYPLLPMFLTAVLGGGAVAIGLIEGVAEAANSLLKLLSGRASDRWQRRKPIVIAGYALSSACRPLIGLAGAWWHVLTVRFLDRVGKGVRSAPRDAMLAACAGPDTRGWVFGFHRAMDHVGAIVGPVAATAFLLAWPGEYRALFLLTLVPGAAAVLVLCTVRESGRDHASGPVPGPGVPVSSAPVPGAGWVGRLPRRYYAFLAVLLLFTLGNSTDAFLLLRLSEVGVPVALIPLAWAALHVVKAGVSLAGGARSDRVGRRRVIVTGWAIYALVYAGFAALSSPTALLACFLVYGVYYGMTEGVEKALIADLAGAELRGTAFGLHSAVTGIGALAASVLFGIIWTLAGAPVAFLTGAALAVAAAVLLRGFVPEPGRDRIVSLYGSNSRDQ